MVYFGLGFLNINSMTQLQREEAEHLQDYINAQAVFNDLLFLIGEHIPLIPEKIVGDDIYISISPLIDKVLEIQKTFNAQVFPNIKTVTKGEI